VKGEPQERLDPRAKSLWRVLGVLQALPLLAAGFFASYALIRWADAPMILAVLPALVAVLFSAFLVFVGPGLLWQRWRYEIRPREVDLQRGFISVTRTLVPMARVQHVDTRQGPLQRYYGLSTVVFYTAAGANEIPQLATATAAEVRDRIAELTGDADEV
jgi:membrane protein YdbS with pleckstrin-like domain